MYIIPELRGDEKVEYLRKSRTDDPLLSVAEVLSKHEQMLDQWVERNQAAGGPIPEGNKYREVGSGETIASRPAMKELLRRIESPEIKAIVCVEPQRLSRGDLEDIGYLVKILRYTETLVITLNYTYDLTDERDRDLFERELMRGNEFLEYQKRIQWNGRLLSVQNGNFIGNTAPYGYIKVKRKEGKRAVHTLEPHPEQAPVVKRVFEMYASGLGCVRIAERLDAELVPPPKGKRWAPESLLAMLSNVHYLGKVKWNQRRTVKSVEDGAFVARRPRQEEYLIFDGKHPAIIDQALWDSVQERRGRIPKNTASRELSNPLAGLLRCSCGKAMVGRAYYDKNGRERCAPRVLCGDRRSCGSASAKMSDILDEVVRVLRDSIADFQVEIEKGPDGLVEAQAVHIENLERRLAELRALEKKQWAEKIKGDIPPHIFEELNRETVEDIAKLETAIEEARSATPAPVDYSRKIVTFQAALDALLDPAAPAKEKNILLKECIEIINYKRERVGDFGHPKRGEEAPIELEIVLRV